MYSEYFIIIGGKNQQLIKITTDLCRIKTASSGAANVQYVPTATLHVLQYCR